MEYKYIVIEGNIGAGKTSLVTHIADELKARIIFEQFAGNPFLPMFYQDPDRYSFQLEISFLADRYQQLKKELSIIDNSPPVLIADYCFSKSLIFAGVTLKEEEYNIYRQIYDILSMHFPAPDLYVYLHLPVDALLSNIRKRGREYEYTINAGYLNKIQKAYFNYFNLQTAMKILILDISNIDFVNDQKDFRIISDYIVKREHLKGISQIIL